MTKKKDDDEGLTASEREEQATLEQLVSAEEREGKSEGETAPTTPPVVMGNETYTDQTSAQPTPDERAAFRDKAPDPVTGKAGKAAAKAAQEKE